MANEISNRIPFLGKLSFYAALLAAFLFSFPQEYMNFGYVLWMVVWSIEVMFRHKPRFEKPSKENIHLYLMLVYFSWFIISLLWTSNFDETQIVFQRRISLLIFPILLLFGINKEFRFKYFLLAFIVGSIFSFLLFQLTIIDKYIEFSDKIASAKEFYEAFASPYKHRTFFSISLILGLLFLFFLRNEFDKKLFRITYALLSLAFLLYIFSSGGRMALIIFLSVSAALIILELWKKNYKKLVIVTSILFCTLLSLGLIYNPRMPKVETITEESLAKIDPRYYMWKSSLGAVQDHFLLGAGIGDRKDLFTSYYDKIEDTKRPATSSHNNFIDNQLELGIIGSILLLGIIGTAVSNRNRKNSSIILLISFAWIMTSIIESSGSISPIYLFMLYLLLIRFFKDDKLLSEETNPKLFNLTNLLPFVVLAIIFAVAFAAGRFLW